MTHSQVFFQFVYFWAKKCQVNFWWLLIHQTRTVAANTLLDILKRSLHCPYVLSSPGFSGDSLSFWLGSNSPFPQPSLSQCLFPSISWLLALIINNCSFFIIPAVSHNCSSDHRAPCPPTWGSVRTPRPPLTAQPWMPSLRPWDGETRLLQQWELSPVIGPPPDF